MCLAALELAACAVSLRPPAAESPWTFPLIEEGRLVCEGEIVGSFEKAEGGLVLFATRAGRVYAVDGAKRAVRWEFAAGAPVDLAPVAAGERVLVVDRSGRVYGLDGEGRAAWEAEPRGAAAMPPLALSGLGVFCFDGKKVVALDLDKGTERWALTVPAAVVSSLVPWKGRIVFGTEEGKIQVVSVEGKVLESREAGGVLDGAAFAAGDILISSLEDNSIAGWNLPSLKRRWSTRLGGIFAGLPAFDGRRFFAVLSNHVLFCLSARTGTTLWWNALPGRGLYPPALAGNHVFAATPTDELVAFPLLGGSRATAYKAPREVHAGAAWLAPFLWVAFFEPEAGRTTILCLRSPIPPEKEKTP